MTSFGWSRSGSGLPIVKEQRSMPKKQTRESIEAELSASEKERLLLVAEELATFRGGSGARDALDQACSVGDACFRLDG